MIITKIQGGLGNQLFQYAAALQLSRISKLSLVLDTSFFKEEKFKDLFRLDKFKVDYSEMNIEFNNSKESFFSKKVRNYLFRNTSLFSDPGYDVINGDLLRYPIQSLTRLNSKRNFLLNGWLQKDVFFSQVSNLLSENLWLKDNHFLDKNLTNLISDSNSVAIHVRRGDMLINPNFVTLESNYYVEAVKKVVNLTSNPKFFIFSDEPDKASELFKTLDLPLTFMTEQSQSLGIYGTKGDYLDFELMRLCKHFIIANSTFSWWPAYLSNYNDNIVISPKVWYKNPRLQTKFQKSGLLLPKWIKQ